MEEKVCSFFGHRKIADSVALRQRIESEIVNLIENYGVNVFLFGSRSDFDSLCHAIVTELKEEYPHIQRRAYTCRSGTCTLEKERAYWEGIYSYFEKRPVTLLGVEEEVEHKNKYTAGKAQYVERNQAMINQVLPNHIFYDLRTTFYTRCEECGVAPPARDHFVGHSSGVLNNTYTDLSDEYLLKEGEKLYW